MARDGGPRPGPIIPIWADAGATVTAIAATTKRTTRRTALLLGLPDRFTVLLLSSERSWFSSVVKMARTASERRTRDFGQIRRPARRRSQRLAMEPERMGHLNACRRTARTREAAAGRGVP